MIPEERRQKLIEKLKTDNLCTINNLVKDFNVSRVTIQRDIEILKNQGLVSKVHGGVKIKRDEQVIETLFNERLKRDHEKKLSIAKKALYYVQDGETIFLDNSTTVLTFANELFRSNRNFLDLTVVTNSPSIINSAIKSNTNIQVMSTGGKLDIDWQMYKGTWVIDFIEKINIDKAFISSGGISESMKITTTSRDLANTLVRVIDRVREVNLLLDSGKFKRTAMINISDIRGLTRIITDSEFERDLYPDLQNIVIAEL